MIDTATWNILSGSYCDLASHNYEIPTHLAKAVLHCFQQPQRLYPWIAQLVLCIQIISRGILERLLNMNKETGILILVLSLPVKRWTNLFYYHQFSLFISKKKMKSSLKLQFSMMINQYLAMNPAILNTKTLSCFHDQQVSEISVLSKYIIFDYWYLCLFMAIWITKLPVLKICWLREELFCLNKKIEVRGQVNSCQKSARGISTSRKIGSVLRV